MKIALRSKRKNQTEQVIFLSPSEYFAPLDDWEECFEFDSTARHERLAEYLARADNKNLEYVEVEIIDTSNSKRHVRREIFWIDNWMSVATDYQHDSEISTEVILEIRESQSGFAQLIKFDKEHNDVRLVMHLLLRQSPSGEIDSESIL